MNKRAERLAKGVKQERLLALLKELSTSIRGNRHFSFTKGCAEYKIRWNVNAMSLRSVMIRAGMIEQSPMAGIYKFTELGLDLKLSEMTDILIDKIDSNQEHLSTYVPDLDKSTLQEPITEEQEADLENNISDFRKEKKREMVTSPFMGESEVVDETEEIRSISHSDVVAYLHLIILDFEKKIHHLRQTILLFENK